MRNGAIGVVQSGLVCGVAAPRKESATRAKASVFAPLRSAGYFIRVLFMIGLDSRRHVFAAPRRRGFCAHDRGPGSFAAETAAWPGDSSQLVTRFAVADRACADHFRSARFELELEQYARSEGDLH